MSLSVIIVTWNSERYIARCLRSAETASKGIACETVVVDNASNDDTVNVVRTQFPQTRLISLAANEGFARACNRGASAAHGEYICFLNPDVEILGNSLAHMVNFFARYPHAAVVGGKLQNQDGSLQPSIRTFPNPLSALAVALKLGHVPFLKRWVRRDFSAALVAAPDQAQMVDFVSGAFFAVRKTFFDIIGGLDERYFIWFEEVDLQRQAKERGGEVWYYPKAAAVHYAAQSFLQVDAALNQERFLESMTKYIRKWFGSLAAFPLVALTPIIIIFYTAYTALINSKLKTQNSKPNPEI